MVAITHLSHGNFLSATSWYLYLDSASLHSLSLSYSQLFALVTVDRRDLHDAMQRSGHLQWSRGTNCYRATFAETAAEAVAAQNMKAANPSTRRPPVITVSHAAAKHEKKQAAKRTILNFGQKRMTHDSKLAPE